MPFGAEGVRVQSRSLRLESKRSDIDEYHLRIVRDSRKAVAVTMDRDRMERQKRWLKSVGCDRLPVANEYLSYTAPNGWAIAVDTPTASSRWRRRDRNERSGRYLIGSRSGWRLPDTYLVNLHPVVVDLGSDFVEYETRQVL